MRHLLFVIACILLAFVATAELPTDPAKRAELQAAGYTDWTPGQTRGSGPTFQTLEGSLAAPLRDAGNQIADTQTMVLDDGNLTALPTTFGLIYGNRFSLGTGGVALGALTLNSFSFYFLEDSLPDTGMFIQPGSPGTAASLIEARASVNITGLLNSGPSFSSPQLNVVPQTELGTVGTFSNTFFLGGWCVNSATTFPITNEMIGLATNGPRQQGYTATSGTGPVAFAAQAFNAILRANVTSAQNVPVELMAFDVE